LAVNTVVENGEAKHKTKEREKMSKKDEKLSQNMDSKDTGTPAKELTPKKDKPSKAKEEKIAKNGN
jgi:hypothetical protein